MGKLRQSTRNPIRAIISTIFLLVATTHIVYGNSIPDFDSGAYDETFTGATLARAIESVEISYTLLPVAEKEIVSVKEDSVQKFKNLAIEYARSNDSKRASRYAEKYIQSSLETSFIEHEELKSIQDTAAFQQVAKKYKLNFSALNLFYLFSALIGIFVAVIINLRKTHNKSNALISAFVLMHSIFILHIFLYLTNLKYRFPDILFMSTLFSFLYGPLIYFYFKRIAQQHKFKAKDLLHLIPSIGISLVFLPIYILPAEEKLRMMLHVGSVDAMPYVTYTFFAKLLSLLIYGYLLVRIYFRSIKDNNKLPTEGVKWQKTIIGLGVAYILFYAVYGLTISKIIPRYDVLYHLQVMAMAVMVLYIGFKAYLNPNLFTNGFFDKHLHKYRKSGLTPDFSEELKEKLVFLLEEEKIYRENDINLEKVAKLLDTTRHNTSQVINEHFDLNFFEVINKYRISEALEILKSDVNSNLHIIDVAYEVGFNNKVTFNKSFKKYLSQTPSQYLISLRA